ncbi:MAG: mannitol dehydrogenase family protein [Bacteroidales bacterium]|nr:mannitol dehydrogenase family protein [Bacteroidales bacterium]
MKTFNYDRKSVKAGIVHFGVGNFHRAHQEYYTNLLLEDPTQRNWGICGAMILPQDERLFKALKSQDGQYTLTVCSPDGTAEPNQMGALVQLLWGMETPEAIIAKIASPEIRIITLTITEGGYNIDTDSVRADIADPSHPRTVFGYVAEGLRRRMAAGLPITILSCDNLQHNGDTARNAFCTFFDSQDKALYEWVKSNVTFPNSMVDRITPATLPSDIDRLNAANGTCDKAPVYTEDFIQWVIEDKFAAGRPAWEKVGAQFTDKIDSYENMKLSLLNASHMFIGFCGTLAGYRKVDDVIADKLFIDLIRTYMDVDMAGYVESPEGVDLGAYKDKLISRFGNVTISDQLARLCLDGYSKLLVYIIPNLSKILRDGADFKRFAFFIATYGLYLRRGVDDKGNAYEIVEPKISAAEMEVMTKGSWKEFLGTSMFAGVPVNDAFTEAVGNYAERITSEGILNVIASL